MKAEEPEEVHAELVRIARLLGRKAREAETGKEDFENLLQLVTGQFNLLALDAFDGLDTLNS